MLVSASHVGRVPESDIISVSVVATNVGDFKETSLHFLLFCGYQKRHFNPFLTLTKRCLCLNLTGEKRKFKLNKCNFYLFTLHVYPDGLVANIPPDMF